MAYILLLPAHKGRGGERKKIPICIVNDKGERDMTSFSSLTRLLAIDRFFDVPGRN